MARFNARRLAFGAPARSDADEADGLPAPALVRSKARRALGIAEAAALLEHLPQPGESLHVLCTARFDMSDVLNHLIERFGVCDRLVIATLGFNRRNLLAMLRWLDAQAVRSLTLLSSIFWRAYNKPLWAETLDEFRKRKQRAAVAHCHAKVTALAFASGERLSIEGSANLCGNGSGKEQFVLVNDAGLCDWHSRWITDLVSRHEPPEETEAGAAGPAR